jgi:hypothetical protein
MIDLPFIKCAYSIKPIIRICFQWFQGISQASMVLFSLQNQSI